MTREVKQATTQSRGDALTPKLLCADLGFSDGDWETATGARHVGVEHHGKLKTSRFKDVDFQTLNVLRVSEVSSGMRLSEHRPPKISHTRDALRG
jgi:hypothetical protein